MSKLSNRQIEKYYCSTFLKEIGEAGQEKLLRSKVLVVGAGGLGSSNILYLSSIGIGTLGIIDFDKVSLDNLPRQVLYNESDVGRAKVDVLKERFANKNSDTKIVTYNEKLIKENASKIIGDYDVVLDCVDNFDTEFILNDVCRENKIPLVIAGVSGFKGQVMLVTNKSKHDFRSLFSSIPNITKEIKESDRGVFPPAVAIVSNIQCAEAVKYLLGIGEPLIDTMLVIDTITMRFEKFKM